MKKNIVLVGFMGAGKSLAAKHLAGALGLRVFATDEWVVQKAGKPIADIFAQDGEAVFRQMEKEAVREAAGLTGTVIDCGGGVPLDAENRTLLKKTGDMFYLAASPGEIERRVRDSGGRPLLKTADPLEAIRTLLSQRTPHYEQADHRIWTDGMSGEEMAAAVIRILENRRGD